MNVLCCCYYAEYDSRHNNNIKRLVKDAKFSDSSAFLGNIEYLPDRHLNRDLLESLADNDYIRQGLNVILIGATGSGKSFIANALGVNACQSGYKTRYIRLPELFSELEAAIMVSISGMAVPLKVRIGGSMSRAGGSAASEYPICGGAACSVCSRLFISTLFHH